MTTTRVHQIDATQYRHLGRYGQRVLAEWWEANTGESLADGGIHALTISDSVALAHRFSRPIRLDPSKRFVESHTTHHWLSSPLPGGGFE